MRDLIRDVVSRHDAILVDPTRDHMPAAVLLLLHERDGVEHLLFQVRSQHVEHHKGEISLPGGGRDPEDDSLLMTALRETEEEIGVHRSHVEVFGRLDDVVTRTNFAMSPYVGAITAPSPYPFEIASIEMEMLLEVPVPHLLDARGWEYQTTPIGELRNYRHGEHLIFGATARVVSQLVDKLIEAQGGSLAGARAALR